MSTVTAASIAESRLDPLAQVALIFRGVQEGEITRGDAINAVFPLISSNVDAETALDMVAVLFPKS